MVYASRSRCAVDELLDGDGNGSFRRWHRQCRAAADMFVELVNRRLVLLVGNHMGCNQLKTPKRLTSAKRCCGKLLFFLGGFIIKEVAVASSTFP